MLFRSFSLYALAVLLRFLLQWVGADFYNPVSQFIVKVTTPALKPLRKFIPGYLGLDLAALVLTLLIQMLAIAAAALLVGFPLPNVFVLVLWGVIGVAAMLTNIYFFAILAMIIVSWVAPGSGHPAVFLLYRLTEPVMAPFRRILPPIGGLDLSPILVFVAISVLQIVLRHMAQSVGLHPALVPGL